jgi:hypothetical protein
VSEGLSEVAGVLLENDLVVQLDNSRHKESRINQKKKQ